MQVRSTLHRSRRQGVSLLEVVIALAIFVATYAVISRIVHTGTRAAVEALAENEAVMRGERVMNEILAGVQPFSSSGPNYFEDDSNWSWKADIADGPNVDLKQITVTVTKLENRQEVVTETLVRYTRDPQLFLDAAADAATTSP